MKRNRWLNDFEKNFASQNGEDGIIEKIFEIVPDSNKWCVEFGAWDGQFLSNCFNLIKNHGWKAVMIEPHKKKFRELQQTYGGHEDVICMNRYVDFDGDDTLDNILASTPIPVDFDLVSIDIDGNDYHIWDSIRSYRPKVVIIEFNHTIPIDVRFVQERNHRVSQGNSILAMTELAKSKGYELICTTTGNAFYVDKRYYDLFGIQNNSIDSLFDPVCEAPRVFQLYDGTIMLTTGFPLHWKNRLSVGVMDLQALPSYLRFRNDTRTSKLRRLLLKVYVFLKRASK